jgi:2',3'-cyclic-nucleotide 2'-phosphodiesterase (5'-nucleotidase family)
MHVTDPLVEVIRVAIRQVVGPNMSIQFITGHTHIRAYAELDSHAASFEAGRFLDTIGFCSFPTKAFHPFNTEEGNEDKDPSTTSGMLRHAFIEPNRDSMSQVLIATHDEVGGGGNSPTLDTSSGLILSRRIYETQQQLGLSTLVGCSPLDFELDHAMDEDDSLWGLYMYHVIPTMLFAGRADTSTPIFVQGTGAFRYKLFQGRVVLDDVIAVCPFNDTIYQFSSILTGDDLLKVLNVTTSFPNTFSSGPTNSSMLPYLAVSSNEQIDSNRNYTLFTSHFHVADMADRIYRVVGKPIPDPEPVHSIHGLPMDFLTTTSLWVSFIEQEWDCTGQELHRSPALEGSHRPSHGTREERPMTVFIFILILIAGIYVYQKRKEQLARSGYMPIGDPTTALWRSSSMSTTR